MKKMFVQVSTDSMYQLASYRHSVNIGRHVVHVVNTWHGTNGHCSAPSIAFVKHPAVPTKRLQAKPLFPHKLVCLFSKPCDVQPFCFLNSVMSGLAPPSLAFPLHGKQGGLPPQKFFSALDWASLTHPPSSSQGPVKCVTCARLQSETPPSDNNEMKCIDGFAFFCVADVHKLCFAPYGESSTSLSRFRASLSVVDGCLRISLNAPQIDSVCLTLNVGKMAEDPKVEKSDSMCCLSMEFPFVSLSFEQICQQRKETKDAENNPKICELPFVEIRDAIAELRRQARNTNADNVLSNSNTKKDGFGPSLYEEQLQKVRKGIDFNTNDINSLLLNFRVRSSELVMPPGFPYMRPKSGFDGVSVEQSGQVMFLDSFFAHSVAVQHGMELADMWTKENSARKKTAEDKLVDNTAARGTGPNAEQGRETGA